jgi:hypothetical protein
MTRKSLQIAGILLTILITSISAAYAFIYQQQSSNTTQTILNVGAWPSGWHNRIKIKIDHNDVSSALSEFPILIYLSAASGRNQTDVSFIFDKLQSDANRKKIAVTTSDGTTQCYVEIEKWDTSNRKAWLWVKVPVVNNTFDTELYLYYDSTQSDNTNYVGDTGSTPAQNVWDSSYKGVWHLKENPADTAPQMKDSTSNKNNGTCEGSMPGSDQIAGMIDGSLLFDGNNDDINCGNTASLQITAALTIEAWAKPGLTGVIQGIVDKQNYNNPQNGYELYYRSDNRFRFLIGSVATGHYAQSDSTYTDNNWHYIVGVKSSTNYLYVDGVPQASTFTQSITESGTNFNIGRSYSNDPNNNEYRWTGQIDEVRVSNVARSSAWIKASYESGRDHLIYSMSEETN